LATRRWHQHPAAIEAERRTQARCYVLALSALQQSGGPPGAAIRKGDYKLIEFYEDGRLELFNLKADIGERQNLVRAEPKKAAEALARVSASGYAGCKSQL
jgi:hypothetical protein